jgi:hypothetical protein
VEYDANVDDVIYPASFVNALVVVGTVAAVVCVDPFGNVTPVVPKITDIVYT